jgi:hypothetical protein
MKKLLVTGSPSCDYTAHDGAEKGVAFFRLKFMPLDFSVKSTPAERFNPDFSTLATFVIPVIRQVLIEKFLLMNICR